MELKPEDLVITTYRAPWQKNSGWSLSVDFGISIVHRPTGAMVKVDTDKSQHRNRALAMEMLTQKVKDIFAEREVKTSSQELSDFDIDMIADKVIKPVAGERISYAQARKFARAIIKATKVLPS